MASNTWWLVDDFLNGKEQEPHRHLTSVKDTDNRFKMEVSTVQQLLERSRKSRKSPSRCQANVVSYHRHESSSLRSACLPAWIQHGRTANPPPSRRTGFVTRSDVNSQFHPPFDGTTAITCRGASTGQQRWSVCVVLRLTGGTCWRSHAYGARWYRASDGDRHQ